MVQGGGTLHATAHVVPPRPVRFEEFTRRYQTELAGPEQAEALAHLRKLAERRNLTLLTATKEPQISEAAVLADLLRP